MKKLLALLLVLLIPLCACAESYQFSFTVNAGTETFLQAMEELLAAQDTAEADVAKKEAALVQKLVDGFGLDLVWQETAVSVALRLCGEKLIDMTAYDLPDKMLLTTSALPGYALTTPVEESESAAFEAVDWSAAAQSIAETTDAWLAGIEPTEARGYFVGDAFEGGEKSITWRLSDLELATLMSSLLSDEVRNALIAFYTTMGLDAEEILAQLDEANAEVSKQNRHDYVLRVVMDKNDKIVGAALTIMQDHVQIASASLGVMPEGLKLVIGLGLHAQNYWCEINANTAQVAEKSSCHVVVKEWAASKEDAFAYVQGANAPANTWEWQLETTSTDGETSWNGVLRENGAIIQTSNGHWNQEAMLMDSHIAFGPENAEVLSVDFSFSPAEALPDPNPELVECSSTDPADAALYEKLTAQMSAAVMARLLKILPIEQIMQLNQFTMP